MPIKVISLDSYDIPNLFKQFHSLFDAHQLFRLTPEIATTLSAMQFHEYVVLAPIVFLACSSRAIIPLREFISPNRAVDKPLELERKACEAISADERLWISDPQTWRIKKKEKPVQALVAKLMSDLYEGRPAPRIGLHVTTCPCGAWPSCPAEHTSDELHEHSMDAQWVWDLAKRYKAIGFMLPK